MTEHRMTPATAWAWVGIALSIALNILAAWIVVQIVLRPDVPLLPPGK